MAFPHEKSLLILDNDTDVLDTLSEMLRRMKYQVTAVTEADDALQAFLNKQGDFDAVIVNYMLNRTTGLSVINRLKEIRPDISTILFTGVIWADIKERAEQEGITEYLSKPATLGELHLAIESVCKKAQRAKS
jgi:DNA-binding NtrC family response regulator